MINKDINCGDFNQMSCNEIQKLNSIAQNSLYAASVNRKTIEYSYKIFERHLKPGSILELGPAEGIMTELLVQRFNDITVVDGAEFFCENLKTKFSQIIIINSLFENYTPNKLFDNIILGHVLEHVENPVEILSLVKGWVKKEGRIFAAVPNSKSIHRQAAVLMGLLTSENDLNDMDKHHGHRRVYNPDEFKNDFIKSGLEIEFFGGYWIKPFSNKQVAETHTPEMIDAFMKLGERYPDISAEIYIIAKK